jgi:uncharacterized protein
MIKRVAIVGGGIAGLGCGYHLQKRGVDAHVFDKNDYAGGHTHTHAVTVGERNYQVDTGFIVFNPSHYPHFVSLLSDLKVADQATQMSFGVKDERSGLEYNATSVDALFAQRSNLLSPKFWGLIRDLKRFYRTPHPLLSVPSPGPTLEEYVRQAGYGELFIHSHLVPISAALWSSPGKSILQFPAKYLVQFMDNHHMLNTDTSRPPWRVVKGGSQSYVRALLATLKNAPRLNARLQSVHRDSEGVVLHSNDGEERFDAVVFACHSDQALALLANPSAAEREILGGLRYQTNDVLLHTDTSIMPKRRKAWAAWNAHLGVNEHEQCAVTYWMNLLQGIEAPVEFLVSLNCNDRIDPNKVIKRLQYEHPVYTHQTVANQNRRADINGANRSYFCGAYWGFGFHEDGLRSAVDVAELIAQG